METKNGKTCKIYVSGQWAFIPTTLAGVNKSVLYLKVPSCVVYVDCPYCSAKAGERCKGSRGPTTQVHVGRKSSARARLKNLPTHKIWNAGPMRIG